MEALQMLKFALKKKRLDFTNGWITSEEEMAEANLGGEDLLANLLKSDNNADEDVIDEVIQLICETDDGDAERDDDA
jgi:hypothetical protein